MGDRSFIVLVPPKWEAFWSKAANLPLESTTRGQLSRKEPNSGVNVMITFLAIFTKIIILHKSIIRQFFVRWLVKIIKNCVHNIDPL
jgi:hypothetical protein